jgi:hypothetical protein
MGIYDTRSVACKGRSAACIHRRLGGHKTGAARIVKRFEELVERLDDRGE